jgi:spermidine synthase
MANGRVSRGAGDKVAYLVLTCFFLSGLTGLIYEILWTRMIVKIIGSAPFAVSIVLTVFMGGLGIGSYLAGRIIDRVKKPIRLVNIYGLLELAIGAYSFVIPLLLKAFAPLYAILYNRLFSYFMLYNLLTFVGCSLLLCFPVICMGATLPILCRFYVRSLSHLGTHAGRLYGLNTIGAATGSFLCGFWLINLLGMPGTLAFAVTINAAIGLACLLAGYLVKTPASVVETGGKDSLVTAAADRIPAEVPAYSKVVSGALIIFAVSGFCAMAYEVIWTRLLGLIVGPTTYSFTIVLVTFILSLALGSMIFGHLADKTKKVIWLLIGSQIFAALAALVISQLLGNSQIFFAKVIFKFKDHFALLNMVKTLILFCFMVVPTICLGATFPLVGKIYTRSISKVGRSIGFAYMVNTVGAVLGSFCAGFVLIPLVGKERGLSIVISLQLLTALVVAGIVAEKKRKNLLRTAMFITPVLAGLLLCLYFPRWDRYMLSEGKYHRFEFSAANLEKTGWLESLVHGFKKAEQYEKKELLYYGDGVGGFTTVIKYTDPFGTAEYIMANSGKTDASSRGDMATQTLSAHFGMLCHPNPVMVAVIGLASGITAGEVLHYPIKRLDAIEINDEVVAASDFFLPWNNNVLSDPRTNLIIQDGRAHLQLTREKYDVIISEPSNPWMAGLATLFTRDFFMLARDRLNEEGIFVQWIQAYQMDWPTFALIGRSFAEVFPNSVLASASMLDYLLVGFKSDKQLSVENAKQKLKYIQQSKNITFPDHRLIWRLVVSENIGEIFGEGLINTDSYPRLEFAAPKVMYNDDVSIVQNIESKKRFKPQSRSIIEQVTTDVGAQIDFAAYSFSVYNPFGDMVDLTKATPAQRERFFKLMDEYCANNPVNCLIFRDGRLKSRCFSVQTESLRSRIDLVPDKASSYFHLAGLYYLTGMLDEAAECCYEFLRIRPRNADVHYFLGQIFYKQENFVAAISHFKEVLKINPRYSDAYYELGVIMCQQGKADDAIKYWHEAIRLNPTFYGAYFNLGELYYQLGEMPKAIEYWQHALRLNPDDDMTHRQLAHAFAVEGKTAKAIMHLEESLRINPDLANSSMGILAWTLATCKDSSFRDPNRAIELAGRACRLTDYANPGMLDVLAAAYAAAGRFSDAVTTAEKALELSHTKGEEQMTQEIQMRLSLYKKKLPFIAPKSKKSAI